MLPHTPLLTLFCLAVFSRGTRGGGESGEWCGGVDKWEVGCNTCYCRAGVPYCYQGTCAEGGGGGGGGGRCVSGSTWRRRCNLCLCDAGVPVCSYIPCPPSSAPGEGRERRCREGERWTSGCNRCWCVSGLSLCTAHTCLLRPPPPPHTGDGGEERYLGVLVQPGQAFWTPALVYQVGGREGCAAAASRRTDPCTRCFCRHGVPLCSIITTCRPDQTTTVSVTERGTGDRMTLLGSGAPVSPSTVADDSTVSTSARRHTTTTSFAASEDRTPPTTAPPRPPLTTDDEVAVTPSSSNVDPVTSSFFITHEPTVQGEMA